MRNQLRLLKRLEKVRYVDESGLEPWSKAWVRSWDREVSALVPPFPDYIRKWVRRKSDFSHAFIMVNEVYRLMKSCAAKRILFLGGRRALRALAALLR